MRLTDSIISFTQAFSNLAAKEELQLTHDTATARSLSAEGASKIASFTVL
jgi:hypothetical protein